MGWFLGFLRDDDGATAVEYAVMLAMILVVCMIAIRQVGQQNSMLWSDNEDKLGSAFTNS